MWGDELTRDELDVVTSVFRQFETGLREGVIDVKDLHISLMTLGINPLEQEVIDMTNYIARDGLIYFPDFCKIIHKKFREDNIQSFGSTMFKVMCGTDKYVHLPKTPIPPHLKAKKYKQANHSLSWEEFLFIMRNLPVQVNENEIKEMFAVADHDNDGHIGFPEFMIMLNPPNQTNYATKANPIKSMSVKIQQKVQPNTADNVPPPPHVTDGPSATTKIQPDPAMVTANTTKTTASTTAVVDPSKQTTVIVSSNNEQGIKTVLKK